jgi:putative FmdB family regulatory protein
MPTYEYDCSKCHKSFELVQSMKDDSLTVCPKDRCRMKTWGRGRVKRKVGAGAGFIFKGSGFYITDYRSEGYKAKASSDKAPAAGSTSSDSSASTPAKSSEAKPAAAKTAPKKDA